MRRKSQDMQDKVLQFVAYSNTGMDQIEKNSPKSAKAGKFNFDEEQKEPQIASLSNAIGSNKPAGGFAAMLNKKKSD